MTDAERLEDRFTGTGRNDRGTWSVWIEGRWISGHTNGNAAATAYRNHLPITVREVTQ